MSSKEQFNYRHFTDRPEDEDPKAIEMKSSEEEESLGLGFRAFLPQSCKQNAVDTVKTTSSSNDGLCTYNGMLLGGIFGWAGAKFLWCPYVLAIIYLKESENFF